VPLTRPQFARWGSAVYSADAISGRPAADETRVVVVEDDYLLSLELETALTDAGFTVAGIARSAEEAVELVRFTRPVLVFMDVRLAGESDGVDAALAIFNLSGIRCIFATAHYDADTQRRAAPASPLGWLAKPYNAESVIVAVRRALAQLASGH